MFGQTAADTTSAIVSSVLPTATSVATAAGILPAATSGAVVPPASSNSSAMIAVGVLLVLGGLAFMVIRSAKKSAKSAKRRKK